MTDYLSDLDRSPERVAIDQAAAELSRLRTELTDAAEGGLPPDTRR